MAKEEEIWIVQVYDSQEHSLQCQAFRGEEGTKTCVEGIVEQLNDQGGWDMKPAETGGEASYAFDAIDTEGLGVDGEPRKISVDVFKCYLND